MNTTSFLHLHAREGLLRRHTVAEPARRHTFLAFGVHFTAVLVERGSNTGYAVDSWFHANGEPPEMVELEKWRQGREPGVSRATGDRLAGTAVGAIGLRCVMPARSH